eukprot:snap_masked-scaffold_26-processed-gene-3.19-mRNA-1 protein AED:1.00 eAED:1.00 QI:0/0/0/0/1/1/2/0/145
MTVGSQISSLPRHIALVLQTRNFVMMSLLDKRCKLFAPRESDQFKDVVEEVLLEMDKVKSLGGNYSVTQVLKKNKLDSIILFEGTNNCGPATTVETSRGELVRCLGFDVIPGNFDLLIWWTNVEPTLAKMAKKLFVIQKNSASSE